MSASPHLERQEVRRVWIDALLLGASGGFAVLGAVLLSNPLQARWAGTAAWAYAAGAVLACLVAAAAGSLDPRRLVQVRLALLAGVFAAVTVLPMAENVVRRAELGPARFAQSETIIIEEAADALLSGRNPYEATYLDGPLASWPLGTKLHFPYLPGMTAFGLPHGLGAGGVAGDPRIWITATSVLAALAALRTARARESDAVRALQVLLVLPPGALPIAGGGDDVAVLALMLLALALCRAGKPAMAGLAAGVAGAMKQTALVLLPFLILAARRADGRPARGPAAMAVAAVLVPLVVPFAVWSPGAFVDDVMAYPLGLAEEPTLAEGPSLGRFLREAFPGAGVVVAVIAGVVLAGLVLYLVVGRPPRTAAGAANRTALVIAAGLVVATAGRPGYVLYPLALAMWARDVLSEPAAPAPIPVEPAAPTGGERLGR